MQAVMKKNFIATILIFSTTAVFILGFSPQFRTVIGTAVQHPKAADKALFESDEILSVTFSGNIRELLSDRDDNMSLHPVSLSYLKEDGSEMKLAVDMKTRGHFRRLRENCTYPPLLIQFHKNDTLANTVFREQEKLKLVMPCDGDKYVIREWLAYRVYNLVTPKSFRARLVRVKLNDLKSRKEVPEFYSIMIEEEMQMARRNSLSSVSRKIIPEQAERETFLEMAVFQYLIGNTDWSVEYLQNIKLIANDSLAIPYTVPYDFDHAGIVSAPYAKPAEELNLSSVRERRYRGFCIKELQEYESIIGSYLKLKKDIYSIYADCPLLDEKYKNQVREYLDDFYSTISSPKAWNKDFLYPCNKKGKVVIKGMKE